MDEQPAGTISQPRTKNENLHFVFSSIDAHRTRRYFAIMNRPERPSDSRMDDVERNENRNDCEKPNEIVIRNPLFDRHSEQINRRNSVKSGRPARHRTPLDE